ncbi:MAG: hypothetical protein GX322_07860 [Firmicutes bacterium]|nr:hypothetical protein [Bacillota bacterium]
MKEVLYRLSVSKNTYSIEDDAGAALVMTALFLVVLFGFAALVIDVGLLYVNRLMLVNAVDAGALAGVQDLPYSPTMAITNARQYAMANGIDRFAVNASVEDDNNAVRVFAFRDVDLYFARILGLAKQRLTATATARVGTISAYIGVAPFGVVEQDFVFGEQYTLKYGPGSVPSYFRGNFGALSLGGRGASNYERNVKYGHQGRLAVGDWIDTEPGNMSGPTVRGVKYRIDQCQHYPKCTAETVVPECSRFMVVPILRDLDVPGRDAVEVIGFAAFFLEGTTRRGTDSLVVGRFLRTVVPGELGEAGDYGLKGYKLVN